MKTCIPCSGAGVSSSRGRDGDGAGQRGGIPRNALPTSFPNEPSTVPAARGLVLGSAAPRAVSKLLSPAQSGRETASLPLFLPGWSHSGLELWVMALSVHSVSD